jgi:hypothetical protein
MRRKLLALAVLLGASLAASTQGATSCNAICQGKPSNTSCLCPVGTDRAGAQVTCGIWNSVGGCWYE